MTPKQKQVKYRWPIVCINEGPVTRVVKVDVASYIHEYVRKFCKSQLHGPMSDITKWDVSQVTNMEELFRDQTEFNEDMKQSHLKFHGVTKEIVPVMESW